ncbi:hypothetical protein CMV_028302 [Castanea mollissima]|uniref:Uncharacterized protein n=1 Tax=Castanea mollissima TaxID=60419 RepID=A0A8J4Q8M9_9ROSI|nr:hypothetical protein CMV_028302 [Castanea mollissima]
MTAEMDVHGEVTLSEVEEKHSYQDLHKDNSGAIINGNGNGNGNEKNWNKEDADGSYVFVTGGDAVSDDHVEPSDLGGEVIVENVGLENRETGGGGVDYGGGGVLEEDSKCETKVENVTEDIGESEPRGEAEAAEINERIEVKVEESSEEVRGAETEAKAEIDERIEVKVEESSEEVRGAETEAKAEIDERIEVKVEESSEDVRGAETEAKAEIDERIEVKVEESSEDVREIDERNEVKVEESSEDSQVMVSISEAADCECESTQVDDGKAVDGEDNNLESTGEVEIIEESQVSVNNSAESELAIELDDGVKNVEEEREYDLETDGKENEKSKNMVSLNGQTDLDPEKERPELTDEVPVEGALEGPGVELEQKQRTVVTDTELETEIGNGPVPVDNGDGLPAKHTADEPSETVDAEQNGSSENCEILSSPIVCGDDDVKEIPVEADTEEHEVDSEQNSEKASCQVANKPLEPEVVNSPVPDESGDCLAIEHDQDSISENLFNNDIVGTTQNTPEQNGSSKEVECLPSPVVFGKVPVENGESFPTAPDNDTAVEVDAENEASPITENIPTCVAEDDMPEAEVGNLDANRSISPDDTKLEINTETSPDEIIKAENVPDSCSADDTKLEIDTETSPDETVKAENGPDSYDDTKLEINTEVSPDETIKAENGPDACPADDTKSEIKVETSTDETIKAENGPDSCPADDTKLDINTETSPDETIKAENGPDYSILSSHDNNVSSETGTGSVAIDSEEKISDQPSDDMKIESGVSEMVVACADDQHHSISATVVESNINGLVENESGLSTSLGADEKSESEVENTSTLSNRDMPCDDGLESESKVLDGSATVSETALNCEPDVVHVEDGDDRLTSTDSGDKPAIQGAEVMAGIHGDETSITSPEGSTVDALEGQNTEVVKRPFYYLIRVPRYDDENLKEQVKHAQIQVEEKTRSRDAIRAAIQMKRVTWKEYGENFDAAMAEERTARELLRSKRQEMDSVQSMINKVKNAISVEDIGGRIRNMEHAMQHETLDLKEEKKYLHEMRQLKQLREQLSSNMGRQDDVQQALDQKDQIEERMKVLRKELDVLRENVLKAEAVTKAAKKKFNDESDKISELQAQFKAADDIRQEAYAHLQSMKKQAYEKNKYFYSYRDDNNLAANLVTKGEKEELQRLCVNQVEKIMELWNKNDEFRKQYIRCNTRSTLRRLRTLDGRSLGPNEEPPLIPTVSYERATKDNSRVTKDNSVSLLSAVEQEKPVEQEKQVVQVETEKVKEKSIEKTVEQKNQTTKSKKPVKPDLLGNGLATVSGRDEIEEAREEESKLTKEEEELARKAEELRREEEAAKLKEQRKLEEKNKAKEALERKKRNAEKAQARAMLRAQKEAEQKEKEREKKARKKEKKKASGEEATDGADELEIAQSLETPTETTKESETREKPMTVTKRSQKPSQFTKPAKAKAIPPPLRNRGKRRMQTWMWVLVAAMVVFALFLVGNSSFSFNFGLQRFGF